MSAWSESHWVDYEAVIHNVFVGGEAAFIDFGYVRLGRVGWRPIRGDSAEHVSRVCLIATACRNAATRVLLRVTNDGKVTAIQTL